MRNKLIKSTILSLGISVYAKIAVAAINNPAPGVFVDLTTQGKQNTFADLGLLIVNALLGIVAMVSILFIIIGGYQYITSGVNEEMAEQGKKTLMNAIIGLVVTLLAYVIVTVIVNAVAYNQV